MRLKLWLVLLPGLCLFACKEKQNSSSAEEKTTTAPPAQQQQTEQITDSSATYFSVADYFKDQWETRRGSPYVLLRINTIAGKKDTTHAPLDSVLWFGLTSRFVAADIGAKQFLGRYRFDMFDDETTQTRHYHYEALSEDLFTRKLDIATDPLNDKVQSVYVETRKTENGRVLSQKLYYSPDRLFQIQEAEKISGQPEKNSVQEYRYNY